MTDRRLLRDPSRLPRRANRNSAQSCARTHVEETHVCSRLNMLWVRLPKPVKEPSRCPACAMQSLARWRAATASDSRLANIGRYELERCANCGTATIVSQQRSRDPHNLYTSGTYVRPPRVVDLAVEPLRRLLVRERIRALGPLASGSRVLDVGAGEGRLVAALARKGHNASGIEPYPGTRSLSARAGLRMEVKRIEDADVEPSSLEAVVLWHVLEHLQDPALVLIAARRWLVSGGAIVIAVPNLASLQARLGGDCWFHQDVPRHVVHFTERGLRLLLDRCGFDIERVRHVAIEQNVYGMWQTLLNRVTREPNVFFSLVKRNLQLRSRRAAAFDVIITAILGPLLAPAALLLELAAGVARRGGSVIVRATVR
jgi:SAM-dependent methyltransferase